MHTTYYQHNLVASNSFGHQKYNKIISASKSSKFGFKINLMYQITPGQVKTSSFVKCKGWKGKLTVWC